jgi:N-acylneuraminate cytidylyltransferase
MIANKSVLAIIPARGGSKGLPRKNILPVADKPMIAWTITTALQSHYIDRLILSSEDDEIIQVAQQWGCEVPFVRPLELAQDTTSGMDVVLHAMQQMPHYDLVVLLQPTSPLRNVDDIDRCIAQCVQSDAPCVSVTVPEKSPYWMFSVDKKQQLQPVLGDWKALTQRRQDQTPVYVLNGAVYVAEWDFVLTQKTFLTTATTAYLMPPERSLDIDTAKDFAIFNWFVTAKKENA